MRHVLEQLEQLRRLARSMLVLQRTAVIGSWVIGVLVTLVFLDYALRLPGALRLVFLVVGLGVLAVAVFRYLFAATSFRPTLTQLALRAERTLPALAGRLASSVEFAQAGVDRENPLAARSLREAERRLAGESVRTIIRPARTWRDLVTFGGVAALATVLAFSAPALARTGLTRLLAPYGVTEWPARTAVVSLMGDVLRLPGVHAQGEALPLRARNLTVDEEEDRVDVHYRLEEDGAWQGWQHAVLTHQGRGVHERLVDTNADAIEVYFATEDARTRPESILLVPPPAVTRATLSITPPPYARGRRAPLQAELGPGLDDRATTESTSLVGSEATLVFELNKPLPGPPAAPAPEASATVWVAQTFGFDDGVEPRFETLTGRGADAAARWRLSWQLDRTRTLLVHLEDEHGLTNRELITYRIRVEDDHPPSVTITEPQSDMAVLPSALIDLAGEATDDVAVARLGLRAQVQRAGSEAIEDLDFAAERKTDAPSAVIAAQLDLVPFELAENDVVLVTAFGDDVYELDGRPHDTVYSPVRRLRVIGALDFAAQLRRQLSAVRQNAIRIESLQSELQDDVIEHGRQPGLNAAQAQLGDRIADQAEAVMELAQQIERNRLDDGQLSDLLQQSRDLLDYAGRASNRAVEGIEETDGERGDTAVDTPRGERDDDDPLPRTAAPEDRGIVEAQQDVRDELTDLIELLDRDEDTWMVQRQLEGLVEAQQELADATAELADETIGQGLEDLSNEERSELERIVQTQRGLRDESRQLIEEMRRRAAALQEMDPQAASGMRKAADTGEQREVDRDMETAAQRAERNQMRSAGASQQAAVQSLQRMLEDLDETRRARAEELLRQLASLIESIDRLIVAQENELIALALAEERDDYSGRDRSMIRLNQNTQSVAVEARATGQQSRRIARTLDRAADAQGAAITTLRAAPIAHATVHEAEERSLERLKEARELAADLQEETQEAQVRAQREALIEAYRALEEKQVALRAETLELAKHETLDRRQLVEARRIGNAEEEIRTGLADVEADTQEVVDSQIFSFVHRLLDQWCLSVSEALREGTVDIDVTDRQQMIARSIAQQIEALEESLHPPDEFADEQSNGGSGGQGGAPPPLIPPVAEVKRLHGLQEQVYDQTRDIDARSDLGGAQRRQRVRELGRMQRELMRIGEDIIRKLENGPRGPSGLTPPAPENETDEMNDDGTPPSE